MTDCYDNEANDSNDAFKNDAGFNRREVRSKGRSAKPQSSRRRDMGEGEEAEPKRRSGRIQPGEVRNPWGRGGDPTRQPKRPRRAPLSTYLGEALVEEVNVSIGGKNQKMLLAKYLARKTVLDFCHAPVEKRMALLNNHRGVFARVMENVDDREDDAVVWTDEMERDYHLIAEKYDLDAIAEESALKSAQYDDYLLWCRARLDDWSFKQMNQDDRYRAYLQQRDDALRAADRDRLDGSASRDTVRAQRRA